MGLLAKLIVAVSFFQLLHSGFSVYEFNEINKQLGSSVVTTNAALPVDIKYEICSSMILFVIGIFMSFEKISYTPVSATRTRTTGEYLQPIAMHKATKIDNLQELDPYGNVNNAPYVIDIIKKRQEYQEWETQNKSK